MRDKVRAIEKPLPLSFRQLLALIRLAISGKSESVLEVCKIEWRNIYALAEKQSVLGIVFAGIERLPKERLPQMDLLMDWLGQAEYLKMRNEQANSACIGIRKLFAENGFRTAIMKGQGNSRLYKTEVRKVENGKESKECFDLGLLRTSGDIDLWVDASASSATENFEKIYSYVQSVRPTREVNELEIQFGEFQGVPVEVHYKPFFMRSPWKNKRLLAYLNEEADNCFESEDGFTTLRFNRIHQLVHIHHHLMTEGIGLRQIIDYYFVLDASAKDLFWAQQRIETMQAIRNLGLERFTTALMWVMHDCLGLDKECLLCQPDAREGNILLHEIMATGNFGHQDERGLEVKRIPIIGGVWKLMIRNVKLWRFDPWDWFWGPLWRIYHRCWRIKNGFA